MYRRVVVPLDGSPRAEAILPFVERMAGPLSPLAQPGTVTGQALAANVARLEELPGHST